MRPKKTNLSVLLLFIATITFPQNHNSYLLKSPEIQNVKLTGGFWFNRFETNKKITIPHVFKKLNETSRIKNFEYAAGIKEGEFCTVYAFDDSDVFKSIEAASYSLMTSADSLLESEVDGLITLIKSAQDADGYLYTARSAPSAKIKNMIGPERWSNLQWSHELYNMGHLYEAAAAHFKATGKKSLLDIAIKNADLIINTFNPSGVQIPPGHEEIEIGLVKLFEVTGEEKYLKQAKYFLDIRGKGKKINGRESWGEYAQDHKPVVEQNEAVGHAVRAAYLFSAMTDIAVLTGDSTYERAVEKLWENVANKKLYVTGGIGATGSGEAFGDNYDLPNASAYNETCSSIANMMWNYRMFLNSAEGKFMDVLERTLYNAFLSGVGMDGKNFFYPNPLQSFGTHTRTEWFTCACCPPNIARFIASLPEKFYSLSNDEIFVNLFSSNQTEIVAGNFSVNLKMETDYPWHGNIKLMVNPNGNLNEFGINFRIPGWATEKPIESALYYFTDNYGGFKILLNGNEIKPNLKNGYAKIYRKWQNGDVVDLILDMEVHRIKANEFVEADRNKVALQRGPLVYCAEWPESKTGYVRNILLQDDQPLAALYNDKILNGVTTINGNVLSVFYDNEKKIKTEEQTFSAIPYYAWAHRGTGEMTVWIPNNQTSVMPLYAPILISKSKIISSAGKNIKAVNDQIEPAKSSDESVPVFHWWPNKGTTESVQIDFPETSEVSQVEIYWFDDTGSGECRVPSSWKIFYKDKDKWLPVYSIDKYGVETNKYNTVNFETIRTTSIKIEIKSPENFAGGIHEIKIK